MAASEASKRRAAHVRAWRRSGLTQAAYCEKHELNRHTLAYWCSQTGRQGRLSNTAAAAQFVPLRVKDAVRVEKDRSGAGGAGIVVAERNARTYCSGSRCGTGLRQCWDRQMLTPSSWWIAVAPVDLRRGMDGLLATVVSELGRDALDGAAYIFRNKCRFADQDGVRRWHRGLVVPASLAPRSVRVATKR